MKIDIMSPFCLSLVFLTKNAVIGFGLKTDPALIAAPPDWCNPNSRKCVDICSMYYLMCVCCRVDNMYIDKASY